MKLWAMDHGINWDWFALIETYDNETATVVREGRLHKFDPAQGAEQIGAYHRAAGHNRYHIADAPVEFGQPRIATGVHINGDWFPFAEPVGRWDFPGITSEPEGIE